MPEYSTYQELIDRDGANDLDAILSVANPYVGQQETVVADGADTMFTWDYEKGARPGLNKLYEKAKTSQWNGETDLPWDTDVDQEAVVLANAAANPSAMDLDLAGTSFEKWEEKDWVQLGIESQNWVLSQFMHGEQGALLCTAKIVETVPWIDA